MFDAYSTWISPGLWFILSALWMAPALMALKWPGGVGAIIMLTGTAGNAVCFLGLAVDGYAETLLGRTFIEWDSPLWAAHEALFLLSFAAQVAGFFMIILRIRPVMNRLRELEALPPQG